jgi:hypothetical protein
VTSILSTLTCKMTCQSYSYLKEVKPKYTYTAAQENFWILCNFIHIKCSTLVRFSVGKSIEINRLIPSLSGTQKSSQNLLFTYRVTRFQVTAFSGFWHRIGSLTQTFRRNVLSPSGGGDEIKCRLTATVPWRLTGRKILEASNSETLINLQTKEFNGVGYDDRSG